MAPRSGTARLSPCAALLLVLAAGCGKRGDPLPPLRRIPQPVTGLRVAQSGDRVVVTLAAPRTTTEGERLPVLDVELLRADGAGDFDKVARRLRLRAAPGETLTRQEELPAAGTTLRFAARAVARGRPSPATSVVSLVVQSPPPPPATLTAGLAGAKVTLQWSTSPVTAPASPAPSSPGVWLYRRAEDAPYRGPLTDAPIAGTSYEDAAVEVGQSWCYVARTVTAVDPVVESGDSPEACLTVEDVVPPPAPTGLAAVLRDGVVELSWSPSFEADLAHYRVYRGALGGESRERLAELGPADTTYRDATAVPGSVYAYVLTAVDRAGNESPASAPAEVRLP
jgi:hypothetical protein